jgi:hypothetical protein
MGVMQTAQGHIGRIQTETRDGGVVTCFRLYLAGNEFTEVKTALQFKWREGDLVIAEGTRDGEHLNALSISSVVEASPLSASKPKLYKLRVAISVIAGSITELFLYLLNILPATKFWPHPGMFSLFGGGAIAVLLAVFLARDNKKANGKLAAQIFFCLWLIFLFGSTRKGHSEPAPKPQPKPLPCPTCRPPNPVCPKCSPPK